jgi:phosphohistidine phosphatase
MSRPLRAQFAPGGALNPNLIMSSPALCALTTAQLVADETGHAREDIVGDDRLYAGSSGDLLAVIRALDERLGCVMLFGRNPEFTDLAHRLSSEITDMPTCAMAGFRFDTQSWSGIGGVEPTYARLERPKRWFGLADEAVKDRRRCRTACS